MYINGIMFSFSLTIYFLVVDRGFGNQKVEVLPCLGYLIYQWYAQLNILNFLYVENYDYDINKFN